MSGTEDLLFPVFPKVHVTASIRHFSRMVEDYEKEEWEDSLAKSGKFIEAVLKALLVRAGKTPAKGKHFKVDTAINELAGTPAGSVDDSLRLTIPRASRFVYEMASNRGGRHDPDEIDPNEMDAHAAVNQCSWILAEMIRHAQHGAGMQAAQQAVESLMRRRYPLIEEIDGSTYFHGKKPSATEVALVILFSKYPARLHPDELVAQLVDNKFSVHNARVAVARIDRYVHHDANGRIVLLAPGLERAEEILRDASADA